MTENYYEYIIIGAGIGGLQAANILAQHDYSFIILEAADTMGGRIATDTIANIIKQKQKQGNSNLEWITSNTQAMQTKVDYGATWISLQHKYMLKTLRQFGIQTYPQYFDGLTIYGSDPENYERVESLIEYYKNYKKDIKRLLDKIDAIKNTFENLVEHEEERPNSTAEIVSVEDLNENVNAPLLKKTQVKEFSLLSEYIDYYDNITVKDFIRNQLKNQSLIDQILNQIQMLECMSCDKVSMIQLFDDDGGLELLKLYCQKVQNTIDGLKVKKGMISVIQSLANKMLQLIQQNKDDQTIKLTDIIKFNSPVCKISNKIGQDVRVSIKNSNMVYTGGRVLFSVPIAVANAIKIEKISASKQLIFDNQQLGNVTRLYLVFKTAFWRGKYSGYGSFSSKFPFNEMTDLSPASLACGILVFIFIGDKYKKWVEEYPEHAEQEKYMKKLIAKMFLNGNIDSQHLKESMMYVRSFSSNPYIRAAYQATTKPHIWKQVKNNGDQYSEAYSRDQYNVIYIGSEFGESHATYMEGALKLSRQKTYKLIGKKDPWEDLVD